MSIERDRALNPVIRATSPSHIPRVNSATKRILLIDDEAPLRRVTQLTLEITAGWEVLTAGSGLEGLQQAELKQPDAILLDLMMPEMDGIVTLKHLRKKTCDDAYPGHFTHGKSSGSGPGSASTAESVSRVNQTF